MNNIRFYRKLSFFTQKDVSKQTGIPQYRLSVLENGETPTQEELKTLSDFFDVAPSLLYDSIAGTPVMDALRNMNAIGHLFAVKEDDLAERMHLTERALRKMIERERMAGCLIGNDQDGKGYYIVSNTAEAQRFIHKSMRMVKSLSRQCKQFREYIKLNGETPCA